MEMKQGVPISETTVRHTQIVHKAHFYIWSHEVCCPWETNGTFLSRKSVWSSHTIDEGWKTQAKAQSNRDGAVMWHGLQCHATAQDYFRRYLGPQKSISRVVIPILSEYAQ